VSAIFRQVEHVPVIRGEVVLRQERRALPMWATSRIAVPFGAEESTARRWVIAVVAGLALVLFFAFHHAYWVPANGGVDQNGYIVGGKQFSRHLSTRYDAINPVNGKRDPFMFVGMMWIGVDFGDPEKERFYPKYPIGLPVLVAVAHWIGGREAGPLLTYYINPIAMTLAMGGVFCLVRLFAGSFPALIAMIATMSLPNVLGHTNNPNSHATALFCVTWGMFLLLTWAQQNGLWRAVGAGFLLGYAVTIRYTEGLLLLPLGFVILFKLLPIIPPTLWAMREVHRRSLAQVISRAGEAFARFCGRFNARGLITWVPTSTSILRSTREPRAIAPYAAGWFPRRGLIESIAACLAWWVPVGVLVGFNLLAFSDFTGYDTSNESSGFTFDFFDDNWETMLRHVNQVGLFLIFPIGLLGLIWMFARSWKIALVLMSWIAPCIFIYMLYYWAPDGTHIGYLRFVLTIFPALIVSAFWLLAELWRAPAGARSEAPAPAEIMDFFRNDNALPRGRSLLNLTRAQIVAPLTVGAVAGISILLNAQSALPSLEGEQRGNLTLRQAELEAKGYGNIPPAIPADGVIFSSDSICDHLQLVGDWPLYHTDVFNQGFIRRYIKMNPDEPQVFQPQRAQFLYNLLKQKSEQDFVKEQQRVVGELLDGGRRVFFVVPRNALPSVRLRFAPTRLIDPDLFQVKTVRIWNDPNCNYHRKPAISQPRKKKYEPPVQDPRQTAWCIAEVSRRHAPASIATAP